MLGKVKVERLYKYNKSFKTVAYYPIVNFNADYYAEEVTVNGLEFNVAVVEFKTPLGILSYIFDSPESRDAAVKDFEAGKVLSVEADDVFDCKGDYVLRLYKDKEIEEND